MVTVPDADVDTQGAVSPEHVFAHELGHAVMQKRGMSFKGFPFAEVRKWIRNWDDWVLASKAFRPGVHNHENARYRAHGRKPDEIIADAIGSVLLGKSPESLVVDRVAGLNRRDLGLLEPATPSGKLGQDANNALSGQRGMFSKPAPKVGDQAAETSEQDQESIDSLRAVLAERFGPLIARMEARGFLKLWPSTQAFNDGQQSEKIEGPVQGYWDGKTAHLFADGIEPGLEVAVLLHEVGEHASMEDMLGPNRYQKLVDRAYDLVEQGDDAAVRAMDRIPDDTPDQYRDSEFLAYMIETVAADGADVGWVVGCLDG